MMAHLNLSTIFHKVFTEKIVPLFAYFYIYCGVAYEACMKFCVNSKSDAINKNIAT